MPLGHSSTALAALGVYKNGKASVCFFPLGVANIPGCAASLPLSHALPTDRRHSHPVEREIGGHGAPSNSLQ